MDTTQVILTMGGMLKQFWVDWSLYYIFGYVGIILHIYFRAPKTMTIWEYIKATGRDLVVSVICYNVAIFVWWDTGLEIMGYIKNVPNGQTFIIAYFGQSIIMGILKKAGKKVEDEGEPKP